MSSKDSTIVRLQTLAAQGASKIATHGSIASKASAVGGLGFAPGRMVYDKVTGQIVEVIGSTTVHLATPAGTE